MGRGESQYSMVHLDESSSSHMKVFAAKLLFYLLFVSIRFPGGECYRDLIRRLTSVVIDLEQQVIPTLVVSHVSILQCLMAYFRNTPIENCMSIEVPMHTVIKFEPVRGGGFRETQHYLGEGSGDIDPSTLDSQLSSTQKHSETESNNCSGNKAGPIWSDNTANTGNTT